MGRLACVASYKYVCARPGEIHGLITGSKHNLLRLRNYKYSNTVRKALSSPSVAKGSRNRTRLLFSYDVFITLQGADAEDYCKC